MGINSTYYYGGAFMLATLYVYTHWQNFDGGFHRPGNKFKKQKRKAQRDASARGSKLEDELKEGHKGRRHSDISGPRPSNGGERRGRSRDEESRAKYRGGRSRRGDDRYEDSSSDESATDGYYNSRSRRDQHHRDQGEHRVKQARYGEYVTEDQILDDHPSQPPLRPVNANHHDPGTTPSESPDTRLTASYSALTTPDTTSSTALKASNEIRRPGSPVGNQRVNLHKRRASASPHKFSGTRIAPIKDPNNLDELPSDSRTNTVGNDSDIAIYFDSNGALQIKQPPTDEHAMDEALAQPSMMTNMEHSNGSHQHPQSKRSAARRKRPFSLLEAIVRDNSLLLILTSYLHVPSIISLYAISKSFHLSFNRHATAFILSSMRTWAPDADKIFPWRCYLSLCIKDPIRRTRSIPKKFQEKIGSMGDISRDVPSLRWLQMVVWRQAIVTDMIIELKSKALWPPPGTLEAVKKMWFALDLPLNSHRLALFRSKAYMPDKIIRLATHFFIKCDMAFTDPGFDAVPPHPPNQAGIFPNQLGHGALLGCNLREKLSSDRDLTPLWRVLKGWSWDPDVPPRPMVLHDILKLNVRHKHKWPPGTPDHTLKKPIMGMRYSDFRFVGCERTFQLSDNEDQKLQRPLRPLLRLDQLLVGEVVRREMDPPDYLDVVASGFMFVNSGLRVPVMTAEEHNRRQKTSTNVLRRQAFPMPRSRAVGIMRTISKKVKEAAWM